VNPTGGDGLVEILDEDVPLAAVPQTGDLSTLLLALSTFSGSGLALLGLNRKKDGE
jgi:LPXTG-motif cell wall-anchored protein